MTKAGRYAILGDLALVFAVALGFRLMWVVLIPPWTAPDEASHFTYVAHLVEQREIPRPPPHGQEYPPVSVEVTTSWELFLFPRISAMGGPRSPALLPYLPVLHDYRPARAYKAPKEKRLSAGGATATDYPPLYYLLAAPFYRLFQDGTLLSRLFAVRAATALLGALSCCFGYLLAREIRRSRRWGHALGMLMALMPQYVFISSVVNNDVAVFLACTALCWLLVRALRQDLTPRLAASLGMLCGAILLTKPSGAAVVLGAGIVVLYRAFPWRWRPLHFKWSRVLALMAFGVGVLSLAGPWFAFRVAVASELPAESTTDEMLIDSIAGTPAHSMGAYGNHLLDLGFEYFRELFVITYWACFGWLEVTISERAYQVIFALYGVSGVGLVMQWMRRPRARQELTLLVALVTLHGAFLFLVADYYLTFARTGASLGMQGRYFFPTLAPVLYLMLSGLHHACVQHRLVLRLVPFAALLLQCTALARLLVRYYGVSIL